MSPYGTITTSYRAEVQVPGDVYDDFYFTREFGIFQRRVAKGAHRSGEALDKEPYGIPTIQWAEFYVKSDAQNFINEWHNRILKWQELL